MFDVLFDVSESQIKMELMLLFLGFIITFICVLFIIYFYKISKKG